MSLGSIAIITASLVQYRVVWLEQWQSARWCHLPLPGPTQAVLLSVVTILFAVPWPDGRCKSDGSHSGLCSQTVDSAVAVALAWSTGAGVAAQQGLQQQ